MILQNPDVLEADDVGYCMDKNGEWHRWKDHPISNKLVWIGIEYSVIPPEDAPKDLPDAIDWKETWVDNPNYVKPEAEAVTEVRMPDESKLPPNAIGYCMDLEKLWHSYSERPQHRGGIMWHGESKIMIPSFDIPQNIPDDFNWVESWILREHQPDEILTDESAKRIIEKYNKIHGPLTEADMVASIQFDEVNKAKHYNVHPSGVECITVIEHYQCNVANAIKYLWRCDNKHENPTINLKKAEYYIKREIALRSKT